MQLFNVLTHDEISEIRTIFADLKWHELRNTKRDDLLRDTFLEVTAVDERLIPIIKILERVFFTTIVKNFVFCKEILSVKCQRFREGEGREKLAGEMHVQNYKCDLSWALCINGKESYKGGDFIVHSGGFSRVANLEPGGMVIYKTGSATKITTVTEGEKDIICGGIESFIPSHDSRETLYKLAEINELLRRTTEESEVLIERDHADKMNQSWHQLVRILSTKGL